MKKETAELMKDWLIYEKENIKDWCAFKQQQEGMSAAFDELIQYVEAQIDDDWISIKDRLPIMEEDMAGTYDSVKVRCADGTDTFVCEFCCDFEAGGAPEYCSNFLTRRNVTHWRPSK